MTFIFLIRSRPTIKAFLSELSGFSQFSMKIDEVEYVNESTLNKYLDESSGSFVYKVTQDLSVGEHILSFTATDGRGNATKQPITFVFVVDSENIDDYGDVLSEDVPAGGIIPDGIWSAGIADTVYTGSNITQSFRVYDGYAILDREEFSCLKIQMDRDTISWIPKILIREVFAWKDGN